jgi:hypothetical protein
LITGQMTPEAEAVFGPGVKAMFAPGIITSLSGPAVRQAYGFIDARDASANGWVGHGGGDAGMSGDLRIYPKSGYVVAVLANIDPPVATELADYLDPWLPRAR